MGHVINNAYGLQCASIAKLVNRACTVGRVDYVVQSTDKNFLVPVGGAIVSSPTAVSIDNLTKCYAGRASLDPIMDLFITLLSMGQRGLKALLIERERLFVCLNTRLQSLCDTGNANGNGLALVHSPENPISIAISVEFLATLRQQQLEQIQANVQERVVTGSCSDEGTSDAAVDTLEEQMSALVTDKSSGTAVATTAKPAAASAPFDVNSIGAMLFYNCISGTRVIYAQSKPTMINGFSFVNWGSHANAFPVMPYITAAVAVGMTEEDVDRFIAEFDKVLKKCVKKVISR